jgi:cell division protein FtsZ
MQQAERGIAELMESVDTTIVIPNEKLLAVAEDAGFFESFRIADDILRQGVQGISDIITIPGIINRDFADVKTIMARMGYAVMGTASASGSKRTIEAAQKAIASPLLEAGAIDGARGILINITGSASLKLAEVQQACSIIQGAAHEDANIIFGAVLDEKMKDSVKITVIATGFREAPSARPRPQETRTSFAAAHEEAMEFPEEQEAHDPRLDPTPKHIMERDGSDSGVSGARAYAHNAAPAPFPASDQLAGEVISLDGMRDNLRGAMVNNFEQDDLDVPAFLRKRNEVM